MRKLTLLLIIALLAPLASSAQTIYTEVESKLVGTRQIKIQLPRNYDSNRDKKYPVVVCLDGDYLFEPVAGMVDYLSYWEDIPEMIVVGVMQLQSRETDCQYDDIDNLPVDDGLKFFDFINVDLMKHLKKEYRTTPFSIIAGHDYTANYINYFFLRQEPKFQGYISLSPELAPAMIDLLPGRVDRLQGKAFYYMATGTEDVKSLSEDIFKLDGALKDKELANFNYTFNTIQDGTHYNLVAKAIPDALLSIFQVYRPITLKEYEEKMIAEGSDPLAYLKERYNDINTIFGIEFPIRPNDFNATASALSKLEKFDDFKELSKLVKKYYPDTVLPRYYMGRYYEGIGKAKRALKEYQGALGLKGVGAIDEDVLQDRMDTIKDDMGW